MFWDDEESRKIGISCATFEMKELIKSEDWDNYTQYLKTWAGDEKSYGQIQPSFKIWNNS